MRALCLIAAAWMASAAAPAHGADLATGSGWTALASDRVAARVGDSLTVLVFEDASASNTAQSTRRNATLFGGQISTQSPPADKAELSLEGRREGTGRSGRSDRMVAQVSVRVTEVLTNGDLKVAGEEALEVNGEHTRISVAGQVRPSDIAGDNTVLSSRLADARIVYDGRGFTAEAARPGLVTRLLGRLAF